MKLKQTKLNQINYLILNINEYEKLKNIWTKYKNGESNTPGDIFIPIKVVFWN